MWRTRSVASGGGDAGPSGFACACLCNCAECMEKFTDENQLTLMEMRIRLLQGREVAPRAILANALPSENPRTLGSCALAWRCRLTALAVRQARRAPDAPAGLARRYSRHARQDISGELPGAEKFQRRSRSVGGGRRTPAFASSRSPQRLAGGCNGSRSVGFHRFPLRAREG